MKLTDLIEALQKHQKSFGESDVKVSTKDGDCDILVVTLDQIDDNEPQLTVLLDD